MSRLVVIALDHGSCDFRLSFALLGQPFLLLIAMVKHTTNSLQYYYS